MKVVMAFKDDDSFEDYDTSPHCNKFLGRVLQLHQASDWLRTHGAAGCCSAEFFARWIKEKKSSPCERREKRFKKHILRMFVCWLEGLPEKRTGVADTIWYHLSTWFLTRSHCCLKKWFTGAGCLVGNYLERCSERPEESLLLFPVNSFGWDRWQVRKGIPLKP